MANSSNSASKRRFSVASFYDGYLRRRLAAAGLSLRKIDIDGGDTTIQMWAPAAGPSSRPALVFVHGFGPEATWQWRRQAAFFAREFDVYVPNLVFFGESASRSPERSEVFQAGAVGKVMEKLGVERYSVVGTSYGGFVAYRIAMTWPERVARVVIASSAVNMKKRDNEELLKRAKVGKIEQLMLPATASQLRKLLRLAIFHGATNYMPNFFLKDVIRTLYLEKREEKLELLKGLSIGQDDNVCLSPLQQDVLIVWGEHDQIFLLEKAIELKELLGEKARLEVIKNTAHVPQIEDAGQFNNIVHKFLCGTS